MEEDVEVQLVEKLRLLKKALADSSRLDDERKKDIHIALDGLESEIILKHDKKRLDHWFVYCQRTLPTMPAFAEAWAEIKRRLEDAGFVEKPAEPLRPQKMQER